MRALILSWEYPPLIEGGLARHVRKLAENLATLAGELGLEYRAFSLDSPGAVADGLRGVHTLLNCAGPFSRTVRTKGTC